ncbi:hypothetical protein ACFC0X_26745 [Paenibacillus chitinolyticus]|uniref:hypothetical protein n=1 Tax=Paenibacillus chitinolyticus TaxID=79263 RepID=UPI0035DE9A94
MSKKEKNLSLPQVKRQNNQVYKDKKRIVLGQSKLDLDMIFRPSKTNELTAEFIGLMQQAMKEAKPFDAGAAMGLTVALVIRYFTSIETNAKSYEEHLDMLRQLKDADYLDTIMDAFELSEVERVFEEIQRSITSLTAEVNKSLQNEFADNSPEGDQADA